MHLGAVHVSHAHILSYSRHPPPSLGIPPPQDMWMNIYGKVIYTYKAAFSVCVCIWLNMMRSHIYPFECHFFGSLLGSTASFWAKFIKQNVFHWSGNVYWSWFQPSLPSQGVPKKIEIGQFCLKNVLKGTFFCILLTNLWKCLKKYIFGCKVNQKEISGKTEGSIRREKIIFSKHFCRLVNKIWENFMCIVLLDVKLQHQLIKIVEMKAKTSPVLITTFLNSPLLYAFPFL